MSSEFDSYNAGRFSDLANTPFGRELWTFLNKPEIVHAMEVATDLGHPAIAGIEEPLLHQFGPDILEDRPKQLAGHMVRQVMEHKGYILDQNNVKLNSAPFSKATRYRHPDWFRLYVFRLSSDPRELCFVETRSGDRLPQPPKNEKWGYAGSFATTLRGNIVFGIDTREVRDEVNAKGFARRRQERVQRKK